MFPVMLPYFLLGLVFQISVSILVVLISCPALSLVCPVSLPHGFPAYPWFLIGRPGCFVRDEFGCTTENSLLKRIPCVITGCRRCALCPCCGTQPCVYGSLPSLPCCIAEFCALVVCVEQLEIQTLHEWLRGLRSLVLQYMSCNFQAR